MAAVRGIAYADTAIYGFDDGTLGGWVNASKATEDFLAWNTVTNDNGSSIKSQGREITTYPLLYWDIYVIVFDIGTEFAHGVFDDSAWLLKEGHGGFLNIWHTGGIVKLYVQNDIWSTNIHEMPQG